jgi:hypothetical protein
MSHAGSMRRKGATPAAIEAALLVLNGDLCVPPLDPDEVRTIARSAGRYEPVAPGRGATAELVGRVWPAPLHAEALHGLAGEFVRLVGPETESDDASLLFSFLVTLGSIVGRGPHYQVGGDRHYTNLFGVLAELAARARRAIEFARTVGRVEFAHQTRPEWSFVYPSLSEGRHGMLGAVTARAEAQTVRLAMLYALLDQSVDIKPDHLRAALAAWRYCRDSAQFIFGDSLGDPTSDEILNLLRGSDEGVTRNELTDHFKRNKTSAEIGRALAVLHSHGVARLERRETGGRTAEVWKAVGVQNNNQEYEINEKSPLSSFFSCLNGQRATPSNKNRGG